MRKNSIKNTRINGEVMKELSLIIRQEIKDPRIHMMTSVTSVEVAPDLKTCKAYISDEEEEVEYNWYEEAGPVAKGNDQLYHAYIPLS